MWFLLFPWSRNETCTWKKKCWLTHGSKGPWEAQTHLTDNGEPCSSMQTDYKRILKAWTQLSKIAKYKCNCHLFLWKLCSGWIKKFTGLMQELSEYFKNKVIVQDFKFKGKFKPEGKFIPKTVPLMLQCLKISRGHLCWRIHKSNDKRDNRNWTTILQQMCSRSRQTSVLQRDPKNNSKGIMT